MSWNARRILAVERAAIVSLLSASEPDAVRPTDASADAFDAAFEDAVALESADHPDEDPFAVSDRVWTLVETTRRTWSDRPEGVLRAELAARSAP